MDRVVNPNEVNRIAANTVFKGTFTSENDIRMDGRIEGEIVSEGKLVVGPTGVIDGKIKAVNTDFGGTMTKGSFEIYDTLCFKGGSKVNGDMSFKRIQIEMDA
ncbi:MAG: polymer-forming cytoskeletal protein [Bacteroidales bacterium]|nr:polymer-forming cytoskeletal protein [Bacteroidales bacterium]